MSDTEHGSINPGEGAQPVSPSGGRHRSGRGLPNWLLPTAGALALGLLVGLTVADRSADASAERGAGQVVAEAPQDGAAVDPVLPAAPAAQPKARAATVLAHSEPVRVDVPAIGVSSPLVELGLNDDRTLEVPVDYERAGWFTSGTYPGDPQGPPAIIAGHVDDFTGPAVFARLGELKKGAEIMVVREDNTAAVFRVTGKQRFAKDEFPANQLYAPVPASELVLITCTGGFDETARSYTENLVVRARLDLERSQEVTKLRSDYRLVVPESDLPNA